MIEKCDLYYYDGLYLDDECLNKLNINKADGLKMITLLNSYNKVYILKNDKTIEIDNNLFRSCVKLASNYYYRISNNSIIIFPLKTYYGISNDKKLSAVYEEFNIRNVKFNEILNNNVLAMIDDIKSSENIVSEYNKQMSLKKTYNILEKANDK